MIFNNNIFKRETQLYSLALSILFVCITLTSSYGRDISFTWTANPENIDGYRIYYKTGSGGAPYNGSGVDEGPSPVLPGKVTSYTLHGLSDTETYYFALKAYSGTAESVYSDEVILGPGPVNTAPTASVMSITVIEDTAYTGQLTANDADGDTLNYSLVSVASEGTALVTTITSGAFSYTPNANINGSDTFSFKVNDSTVDSNTATVNVTITAVNDPPTANGASVATNENTSYTGQLTANDLENDTLNYAIVSGASKGSAVITNQQTGTFSYSPNTNVTGNDSFTFKVNDGTQDSTAATVNVAIAVVNTAPTANGALFTTDEDTAYTGQLTSNDPDGDALSYSIVAGGSKGSVVITNQTSGAYTYTPGTNINGSDSFTFKVNDGIVDSSLASVSINISAVNDRAVASAASITPDKNTLYTGRLLASDIDGDTLSYIITTDGNKGHAVVTNQATGDFTYSPDQDQVGPDSLVFKVNDGTSDSNLATVNVTINDTDTITKVFGDTIGADFPGTITDTFANLQSDLNSAGADLKTYSWSSAQPNKIANTIVMKVDLLSISKHATIHEAKLYLYQTGANGETQYANSVHKVIGKNPVIAQVSGTEASTGLAWTAVAVNTTENDIPLGLADIDIAEDSINVDNLSGYKSWKITSMVQEWVENSTSNYGLFIKGVETATETGRNYAASENANAGFRPKLEIRYSVNVPAPKLIMIQEIKD